MRWIKRCRFFRGCCWHVDKTPILFPIPQSAGCQQPVRTAVGVRTCCRCKRTQYIAGVDHVVYDSATDAQE
jgi:hypothetical protein